MHDERATTLHVPGAQDPALYLHIAEYSALTTRITYWITLQFSIASVAGGALGLLLASSGFFSPEVRIWVAVLIVNAFICVYYYTLFEIMNNSQYLECELAPRVRALAPGALIWQYENFRSRNAFYSAKGLYISVGWSLAVTGVGVWLRWPPLSKSDILGALAALALGVWALLLARATARAQEAFWSRASKSEILRPGGDES